MQRACPRGARCLRLLCRGRVLGPGDQLREGRKALDVLRLQAHLLYLQRPREPLSRCDLS